MSDPAWWQRTGNQASNPWREARRLDLDDLNLATSSERLALVPESVPNAVTSVGRTAVQYGGRWFRALWARPHDDGDVMGHIVFGVASHNQRRVADALQIAAGSDTHDIPIVPVALVTSAIGVTRRFPLGRAYADALRFLGSTVAAARTASGYQVRGWRLHGADYALTPGLYVTLRRWLAAHRPSVVVVSNDHAVRTRVLIRAARDEGIPSVYLQHASVTDRFPPLDVDVALLDGRDACDKYLAAGPTSTRIFLTGSPLHDALIAAGRSRTPSDTVGLCLNLLDDRNRVIDAIRTLCGDADCDLEVRSHPRDGRPWREWLEALGVGRVRSARSEPIEAFLGRVGIVFAGDTNVHLEAALFGRPSAYLRSLGPAMDHYGFIRSGLVAPAETLGGVRDHPAHDAPERIQALRRYSATVGTPWAGNSCGLARAVLQSIATRVPHPPSAFAHAGRVAGTIVYSIDPRDLVRTSASVPTGAPSAASSA